MKPKTHCESWLLHSYQISNLRFQIAFLGSKWPARNVGPPINDDPSPDDGPPIRRFVCDDSNAERFWGDRRDRSISMEGCVEPQHSRGRDSLECGGSTPPSIRLKRRLSLKPLFRATIEQRKPPQPSHSPPSASIPFPNLAIRRRTLELTGVSCRLIIPATKDSSNSKV